LHNEYVDEAFCTVGSRDVKYWHRYHFVSFSSKKCETFRHRILFQVAGVSREVDSKYAKLGESTKNRKL